MGLDIGRIVDSVIGRKSSGQNSQPTFNKFDYYSGSQIGVWFGNVYIDDIQSIQWSRSQAKKPIYGYASQTFDAVASGAVIISGSFVINFRQAAYVRLVMEEIRKIYNGLDEKGRWSEVRRIVGAHLRTGSLYPFVNDKTANGKTATAQNIIDFGNSDSFMAEADMYEDLIWGSDKESEGYNSKFNTADVFQSDELADGFNILITYGNTSQNQATKLNDYLQSTTKSLNGVHLIGESQVIQVGGQPILEQYDFIARNTDEYVGER